MVKRKEDRKYKDRSARQILEVTTGIGCPMVCPYCPQDVLVKAFGEKSNEFKMSLETFKTCINKIPKEVQIAFSGMYEPWLNPETTKMLMYAYKKGHPIRISTTLIGTTPNDVKVLGLVNCEIFTIHLIDINNKIIIIDDYIRKLKSIVSSRLRNSLNLRVKSFGSIDKRVDDIVKDVGLYTNFNDRAGNISSNNFPKRYISGKIKCGYGLNCNVLLPNGDVVLCCQDYEMKHVLGNLIKDTYEDLFNSDEFIYIRKALLSDEDVLCRRCIRARRIS